METPEGPSDAELIARVRNGDLEAYGELYARHHYAAERMARQLVPANDADDLASEAFAKVLDALRVGGGPDVSFRAYLLTAVRRGDVDRVPAGREGGGTPDIPPDERGAGGLPRTPPTRLPRGAGGAGGAPPPAGRA